MSNPILYSIDFKGDIKKHEDKNKSWETPFLIDDYIFASLWRIYFDPKQPYVYNNPNSIEKLKARLEAGNPKDTFNDKILFLLAAGVFFQAKDKEKIVQALNQCGVPTPIVQQAAKDFACGINDMEVVDGELFAVLMEDLLDEYFDSTSEQVVIIGNDYSVSLQSKEEYDRSQSDREEKIPDNWEIAEKENQRIIDHYSKMEGDSSSISDNSQRRPFVDYEAAIFTDFVKPIDTETKAFDSKKVYRLSIYLKLCSYYIRRLSKIVEIYNIDSSVIEELQEALIYAYTIATSEELYNPQNYIQTLISKIEQLIEQPIERQNPNSQAALLFLMAMLQSEDSHIKQMVERTLQETLNKIKEIANEIGSYLYLETSEQLKVPYFSNKDFPRAFDIAKYIIDCTAYEDSKKSPTVMKTK